jgi:hypothetical protein
MDCERDRIMLKNKAVQNESTSKPPTILEHKMMINALITNKNKPNVTIVTGRVKKTKIGLINVFSSPKTTATNIDVTKLETVIPDMK